MWISRTLGLQSTRHVARTNTQKDTVSKGTKGGNEAKGCAMRHKRVQIRKGGAGFLTGVIVAKGMQLKTKRFSAFVCLFFGDNTLCRELITFANNEYFQGIPNHFALPTLLCPLVPGGPQLPSSLRRIQPHGAQDRPRHSVRDRLRRRVRDTLRCRPAIRAETRRIAWAPGSPPPAPCEGRTPAPRCGTCSGTGNPTPVAWPRTAAAPA